MTIGSFDFRTPTHPTVAAEFVILKFADGFRWEMKPHWYRKLDIDAKLFEDGHPTLEACEKAALRHLRSLPARTR